MQFNQVQPSDEELRVMLEIGFILRETGKFSEAETLFRGAVELLPESDVPRVGLGTVFLQSGKFDLAQEIYEDALKIKPESWYARVHRAEVLLFQRRRNEAEHELNEIIENAHDSPHRQTAIALLEAADLICPTI
jgi:tetratricopeptide (TPR) repeat protein